MAEISEIRERLVRMVLGFEHVSEELDKQLKYNPALRSVAQLFITINKDQIKLTTDLLDLIEELEKKVT